MRDVKAVESFSDTITAVMAEAGASANISYKDVLLESTRVRGVSAGYEEFNTYAAAVGRLPSRAEIERGQPVVLLGWDTAEKLFKGSNPIDQVIQIRRHAFPCRRRQREEGVGLRQLAGRVRDDPAQQLPAPLRIAPVARDDGQARDARTS